jgi:membrane-associated phospholipid phosphatase
MNWCNAKYHLEIMIARGRKAMVIFFLLACSNLHLRVRAQAAEPANEPKPDTSIAIVQDVRALLQDVRQLSRATGSIGSRTMLGNSYFIAGGIAAEAAMIFGGIDTSMQGLMQRNQQPQTERYIKYFNQYGELYAAAGIVGGMYITGLATSSSGLRTAARRAGETLVIAGITTTVLKAAIGRARPYMNLGSMSATPFAFNEDNYSWPSGHTAVAFSLSSSLARSIDNVYIGALLYAGAAGTGIARMYYDKHWLSDVVAGAAIGTLSAQLVHTLDDRNAASERNNSSSSVGSMLMIGPSAGGISLCYAW